MILHYIEKSVFVPIWKKFHQEFSSLKSAFKSNGYPKNFIDLYIKKILDELFVKNKVSLTVPKLQLVCVLPIRMNLILIWEDVLDAQLRKIL